jgi:stress response protein SCP2
VQPLTHSDGSGTDYGYLLPDMITLSSDLVEGGCEGRQEDRVIILAQEESFAVNDCCSSMDDTLTLGLQWDMKSGSSMDLDLGCLCMSEGLDLLEAINFENLVSASGGITHGGDARRDTGEKDDDEVITLALNKLPPDVVYLGFYVSSFDGQPLNDVQKCYAHFFDTETLRDLCMFIIDDGGDNETFGTKISVLVALVFKVDEKWYFKNAGAGANGVTVDQNVDHMKGYITACNVLAKQREINGTKK